MATWTPMIGQELGILGDMDQKDDPTKYDTTEDPTFAIR